MGTDAFSLRHGMLQKLACRLGHHHRDGKNVRRVDKKWRSSCTGCGASMVKTDKGWMLRADLPDTEKPARGLTML